MPGVNVASAPQSKAARSAKASYRSRAELQHNHIFVRASDIEADRSGPSLHAISRSMEDAINADVCIELLSQVEHDGGKVLQVFAEAEADPSGLVRASRATMNTDSDIHGTRRARAAMGNLVAGSQLDMRFSNLRLGRCRGSAWRRQPSCCNQTQTPNRRFSRPDISV